MTWLPPSSNNESNINDLSLNIAARNTITLFSVSVVAYAIKDAIDSILLCSLLKDFHNVLLASFVYFGDFCEYSSNSSNDPHSLKMIAPICDNDSTLSKRVTS